MSFDQKVALITGGANGVGKAISKALLDIGMKVCICDINENALNQYVEELSDQLKSNIITVKCDVSVLEELRAAFEQTKKKFGRIDVVVNNAGTVNEIHWRKVIDVNFVGVIHGIHLGFEYMDKNKGGHGGHIINTASNTGFLGVPYIPIYAATKHGVVGLTRSYGDPFYYDKTGVAVNAVCPSATDTNLFHTVTNFLIERELAEKYLANEKPMNPDKVAKGVVELLESGKNGALLRVQNAGNYYAD